MLLEAVGRPAGAFPADLAFLLAACLAFSALGFFRTVWFVSLGYGLSVTAQAVLLGLLHRGSLDAAAWAHLGLLALYGLRLSAYLTVREARPSYAREKREASGTGSGLALSRKLLIWIGVAVLYVLMASPGLYHARAALDGRPRLPGLAWAGLGLAAAGLGIEALADLQKSAYKKADPGHYCDAGLYRVVRCPNYFGEILFWTGGLLAGAASLKGLFPWAAALAGWACIVLIMMGSTKRLEAKQEERYGDREDFRAYAARVPVLFPLVPVYTLKNIRVFLE